MESQTIDLPLEDCSICNSGTEHYFIILTVNRKIVVCSECSRFSLEFLYSIITIDQKADFFRYLEKRSAALEKEEIEKELEDAQ